tara:strand:- start:52 stop:1227 length:1176 start_codon:yes stop_codon:yes gene_type:complete
MKILIYSFNLGPKTSASGITTHKVILELQKRNHEIYVVTGKCTYSKYTNNVSLIKCNPNPLSPARVFKKIGNFIGIEINYIFWEMRAYNVTKNLIKKNIPDVIYGRGSPISSLSVASRVSKKFQIPFLAHFADPIPAPYEWLSNKSERNKLIKTITPIIDNANQLSFVTKEMMLYQSDLIGKNISNKSFISPNGINFYNNMTPPDNEKIIVLYLGSFYGSRTPDSLLDGFNIFHKKNPNSELHFYGTNKSYIESVINKKNIKINTKFFKYTDKIFEALLKANILVDIDNKIDSQVFLSSKLMDYLSINRFILLITTKGSPSSKIIDRIPKTTLKVSYNAEEVAQGLKEISMKKWDKNIFLEREALSEYFITNIIDKIESKFEYMISKGNTN